MRGIIYFLIIVLLTGCVSKKKYERQTELTSNYKQVADEYKNKYTLAKQDSFLMAKRIDSLMIDSIEMSERLKTMNVVNNVSVLPSRYKPQTISDERAFKLKVIYIYNIASGTEWESKYKKGNFVIGVLGKSPITAQLQKEFAKKKKGAQVFTIIEFESVKDITDCPILFVPEGNYKNIAAVKAQCKKYCTLLISEQDYPALGAHFNLAVDGDAIKMNANRDLIKKSDFTVSKSLLNDAQ